MTAAVLVAVAVLLVACGVYLLRVALADAGELTPEEADRALAEREHAARAARRNRRAP